MYTGRTEQPCCLCGSRETTTRIDVPPRTVQLIRNAGPTAWRDIVGEVSIHSVSPTGRRSPTWS